MDLSKFKTALRSADALEFTHSSGQVIHYTVVVVSYEEMTPESECACVFASESNDGQIEEFTFTALVEQAKKDSEFKLYELKELNYK